MHENGTPPARYLSIVYVSTATVEFTKADLAALLETSRTNNRLVNVTGMLLHHDGSFMQAIEGPHDEVRALHTRITNDRRHTGIMNLLECEIDQREFGDWQMAFRDIGSARAEQRAATAISSTALRTLPTRPTPQHEPRGCCCRSERQLASSSAARASTRT